MIRQNWIKVSVIGYIICTLTYNFIGTASPAWTNFYYTSEKGFALLCLLFNYQEGKTLIDKLFVNYAVITQTGTWAFFILCSFNDKFWVYHQTFLISCLIIASFGSLIALWVMIRRTIS